MLSDDTEFTSSGIGNMTGMKYLENYKISKQTLIEGLAMGKSHFLDLFVTWNCEVFPCSQVSEDISDSQLASSSGGGNMGRNQGPDITNVASILKQLSFEENDNDKEEDENILYYSDRSFMVCYTLHNLFTGHIVHDQLLLVTTRKFVRSYQIQVQK